MCEERVCGECVKGGYVESGVSEQEKVAGLT